MGRFNGVVVAVALLHLVEIPALSGAARAEDAAVARGAKVFATCQLCHMVGEEAHNTVGPELNGVVGRRAGSVAGYAYSPAMAGSGLVWDAGSLARFLKAPKSVVPGTKMAFAGLAHPAEIDDVIAYLKTLGPDGKPVR